MEKRQGIAIHHSPHPHRPVKENLLGETELLRIVET